MAIRTPADREIEQQLGAGLRAERLAQNIDQATVARKANVALGSLKNLEQGKGATVLTLVRVLRALGREDVLDAVQPAVRRVPSPYGPRRERKRASPRVDRDGAFDRRTARGGAEGGERVR